VLEPEHFYAKSHQKLFAGIKKVVGQNKLPGVVTVADALGNGCKVSDLVAITDNHPVVASVERYCELVIGYAAKRDLIAKANAIIKRAMSNEDAQGRSGLCRGRGRRDREHTRQMMPYTSANCPTQQFQGWRN
jgi:replicative DNA helicase